MKCLFALALLITSLSSFAQDIFVIKKSMNPKNVLHYKVNVDDCKLKAPAISAYWIMGEEDGGQEVLSSKEKSYFQPKISYSNSSEADFSIGAMEEMGSKIPDKSIRVRLENCKPRAFLEVNHTEVELKEIFVSVNFMMSVDYMNISGISPNSSRITKKIQN